MGNTCGISDKNRDEVILKNTYCVESLETDGKLTKIITDYQSKNERLKFELNTLRELNDATLAEHEEKTKKNEEVLRELREMKALLDEKNRALVRGRLEAALLSKATSMLAVESKTKLCMKGWLLHHYKRRSKKKSYVEVHVSLGEVTTFNFNAGCVVMTYSERKNAKTSNRFQVLEVILSDSKNKENSFTLKALVEGVIRDVTFSCESAEQRDDWMKSITDALAKVKATFDDMHSLFTLKIEFTKEKMGLMVKEKIIDYDEADKKKQKSEQCVNDSGKKRSNDLIDNRRSQEDKKEDLEAKKPEQPCELLVIKITDDDLIAAGLQVNCIVREINGTVLTGMVFSKQLQLLMITPKPYVLTFTGQKFLKHKPEANHGYFPILKELLADGDNCVKMAFSELIAGTSFELELSTSNDKKVTMQNLLSNQTRLISLLRNFNVQ